MDIDINYQKIIKKLKIKLFKSERYFEYFKSFLISLIIPPEDSIKKIKVYNLINSKHSIQKKPPKKFWYCIYIKMVNSSNEFPNNISMLEEKYLQYYSLYIYKYLCSISEIYSADINLLKQEYLNLCIKFINHTKNKRLKTLRIASNSSDSNNKNNNNISKEKSSEDDEDNEKNIKKYGDKKPKTLIEKELFRLKIKSSNEIVDEFIGDINNDLLIKKKKEIFFLHYIKYKKNYNILMNKNENNKKEKEKILNSFKDRGFDPDQIMTYINNTSSIQEILNKIEELERKNLNREEIYKKICMDVNATQLNKELEKIKNKHEEEKRGLLKIIAQKNNELNTIKSEFFGIMNELERLKASKFK